MRLLINVALLAFTATLLSACGHNPVGAPSQTDSIAAALVCAEVTEPAKEELDPFVFYSLPFGTTSVEGVPVDAGVTLDGIGAILGNGAKLQKREGQWQGRKEAVNDCLHKLAVETVAEQK